MVDGGAVDWFSAAQIAGACRTHQQCEVCRFRNNLCTGTNARPAGPLYRRRAEISLCRRIASRRSNASAHTDDRGCLWQALPPQNGAPVRLIVPWKYGFKGIKSIVSIKLTRERPPTTWNLAAPDEYGFYANVNPHVDHPRWSQATERFIGSGGILDVQRQPTLLFNGYADQVASLYRGLDLRENFWNASDSKTGDMAES